MKLVKIEPVWEYIPLAAGWTGEAYGNTSGGRVTLRVKATRSDEASSILMMLPLHMRPGNRSTYIFDRTTSIGGSGRGSIWLTSNARAVNASVTAGHEYYGEFTYMT